MKAIFKIFLILFLFTVPFSAFSAPLSLEDAIKNAVENNEDIHIANFSIAQMEQLIREVESVRYPTLSAGASYQGYVSQQYPSHESASTPRYENGGFTAGLSVEGSQILYAFGLIRKSLDAAKLSRELTVKSRERAVATMRYSVQSAYLAVLMYDELYEIAQESYRNALKTKELLEKSATVRASQSDLIKVEADIASRKPEVDRAQMLLKQGYRMLEILCVLTEPVTSLTTGYNKILRPALNEAILLARIPDAYDVKVLETQVMLNMKTAEVKAAGNNPTVNLIGQYSFSDQSPHLWLSSPTWKGEGYLGVALNIPLYDGGKAKAQSRQELIMGYSNTSRLMQTKRYLSRGLRDALETYNVYQNILIMDDEAIKLAQRSYEMSLSRFLNGQTSAVELNDVERSLSSLKQKRSSTINTIYVSLIEIENMIGTLQ